MSIEITGSVSTPVYKKKGRLDANRIKLSLIQVLELYNLSTRHNDIVKLTASAMYRQAAERWLKDVPVVDQERVDRIRNAIQSGEYKIDPVKVADKFIRLETALFR